MKSVESMLRAVAALSALTALCALLGCASVARPAEASDRAPSPSIAITTAAAPAIETKPKPTALPAVDAATQAQFDRALQAQRAGRNDEALRLWMAFAQAHPELAGAHANLGLLHRQAGRDADAVAALEHAVKLNPTQPGFFNELGIAYRAAGQFAKAQQAYESALALDAQHASALLNLAILHDLYLGNGAKALALYERYLGLLPGGDAAVTKWAADLRQRKPAPGATLAATTAQIAGNAKEQR
ncbi:MAG: tetratricopeptide repeat protein [Burkholderiaceae bacterium]